MTAHSSINVDSFVLAVAVLFSLFFVLTMTFKVNTILVLIAKLALALVLGGLFVTAWLTGWLDILHNPSQMKTLVLESGEWGYLLFLLTFVLIQPLGIPGIPWVIGASLIWPLPVSIALSLAGSVGASIAGFSFARYIARDWVARHLPARFHRFDDRLGARSLQTVILIYLVFFLAPPVPWLLGLSKVRFWPFIVGATIGILPGIVAICVLGGTPLIGRIAILPSGAWMLIGTTCAGLLVFYYLRKRRRTNFDKQ